MAVITGMCMVMVAWSRNSGRDGQTWTGSVRRAEQAGL